MKKFIFLIYFSIFFNLLCGAEWYEKNRKFSVVFPNEVWKYIEKANYYSNKKDNKTAEAFLRIALEKTEKCEPFTPSNWPFGWPRDKESLKYLKYGTPVVFIYKIIGDFCLEAGYIKESIKYLETYLSKCLIPDADYYILLAGIYEKEGMYTQALNLYYEISKFIENKNFWGTEYSIDFIERKIKNINLLFKKNLVIILKPIYIDIPSFIQSDFIDIFKTELSNIKNLVIIPQNNFLKVLNEQKFDENSLDDNELAIVGKILNVDYALKPSLAKIVDTYVFNVDVFSINKKKWFEHYEYKTDDMRYIPNMVKRFTVNFQGLDIPPSLYLPETKFLWSYELDDLVNDLKTSKDKKNILIGCDSGSVYLFNNKGSLLRKLNRAEKIIRVSISPEGNYFSFFTLEGILYFVSKNGEILWTKKTGNLGRGIGISEDGKFIVAGIDKKLIYIDRYGEIFWEINLPEVISFVDIKDDGSLVFVGTEDGKLYCYRDDGNLKWQVNVDGKVIEIKSGENYICSETYKGMIYLYNLNGYEIKKFRSDEEVNFNIFSSEIFDLISGKKGNFLFFLSYDKKSLWRYLLKERVTFLSSLPDGKFIISAEGKNLFAFSIVWK
ncbi:MAG: PQQ-binding-like beta-propeller repeat protein [Candidatus Omnitrophica bacterium]|nr:PQQ-binding-like beta-propeller repeat protein [Candidatus Omnitrophota bacterium]